MPSTSNAITRPRLISIEPNIALPGIAYVISTEFAVGEPRSMAILGNEIESNTGSNRHHYRFLVFLDQYTLDFGRIGHWTSFNRMGHGNEARNQSQNCCSFLKRIVVETASKWNMDYAIPKFVGERFSSQFALNDFSIRTQGENRPSFRSSGGS